MPKATIKLKNGAVITIEGGQSEVTDILSRFQANTSASNAKEVKRKHMAEQKGTGKRARASDLVIALKEEGFFKKPRGLGEIGDALQTKGYIYPITTLSGVVLALVQKKFLGRKKNGGKWIYGN